MKLIKLKEMSQIVIQANLWFEHSVASCHPEAIYLPAGQTPIPLYLFWQKELPNFLKNIKLIQIDEIISGIHAGQFKHFFEQQLPAYRDQFQWITEHDPRQVNHFNSLALLGLGSNGHIAFHEPHLPADFSFGKVTLEPATCQRLKLEPDTQGLTYGLGTFMQCKRILLMVIGESKRSILDKVLNREPSLPASQLLNHPDLTILTDIL